MTALVMMAILLDRSPLSLRLIAFAAMMVLVFVPHSLVGVSFQMSFSAVAALICFFKYIRWTKFTAAEYLLKSDVSGRDWPDLHHCGRHDRFF